MAKHSDNLNLCDFVEWELEEFRKQCNFTEDELRFFNLRAKSKSHVAICRELHYGSSKISELSTKVKRKISKVLPL